MDKHLAVCEKNTISVEGKLGCNINRKHKQQETSLLYVLGSHLLFKVYPSAVSRGALSNKSQTKVCAKLMMQIKMDSFTLKLTLCRTRSCVAHLRTWRWPQLAWRRPQLLINARALKVIWRFSADFSADTAAKYRSAKGRDTAGANGSYMHTYVLTVGWKHVINILQYTVHSVHTPTCTFNHKICLFDIFS